jgi:hypothetical protein
VLAYVLEIGFLAVGGELMVLRQVDGWTSPQEEEEEEEETVALSRPCKE